MFNLPFPNFIVIGDAGARLDMALDAGHKGGDIADDQTEGCSGAEVVSICQDAALSAMNENVDAPFVSLSILLV
jgi:AAA family ATPase